MHVKKNVCESLVGTLLNTNEKTRDHGHARADLKKMGIKQELWLDELLLFLQCNWLKSIKWRSSRVIGKKHYETLYFLEMYFPPAFFDVSVYFTAHLIKEINLLGHVFLHQMYTYERFNGVLKSFVRNWAYPEGSMVQGYCTEEAVEWALNYVDSTNSIGVPKSHHEGRLTDKGTIGKKVITPDPNLF
jgi:hypothetical protein